MRTLYLLRHAKSSWDDSSLADHDRPLAPRGRRAAPSMGRYMQSERLVPELVLCSTAARTRATWALAAPFLGDDIPVEYDRELYGASAGTLLRVVRGLPDDVRRVLMVGHNPGWELFAAALAGDGDRGAIARMRRKFPTAALAVLESPAERWTGVEAGGCRLERFVRPKDLPEAESRRL
ncbi:MAG TPA: histidine phosphatase family protein [Longimicrobiales bacterium]|nr:histidine phosphatase family protein [Longimicrobiales bacterium]